MNFKLTLNPDKTYYKEAYKEMISSLKLKKYEPIFATLIVVLGLFLYFYDSDETLGIFPFAFIGLGIYEFYKSWHEKRKWLKDRLESRVLGHVLMLEFNEDIIKHSGPFSNGEIKWNGLKDIIKTKNGMLLKPESGISIYLPNRLFTEGQIEFIMSKKRKQLNN
jgi:hypothetical protein